MLIEDIITAGHARALLGVEDADEQFVLAQRIIDEKLNVRDIEKIVRNRGKAIKEVKKKANQLENVYKDIETRLKNRLSTKVNVTGKEDGTGSV